MQQAQDDDSKDGRYFPSDSEMPILIHYLQIYFSHPERSIQRSQVVQNVVSILSPTNKHWNHRTIRLWFNNNKRVFYRPASPQQLPEQNQIAPSSSVPTSFSQDPEPPSQPIFNTPPIPKCYLPTRSLSVAQVPTIINPSQDHEIQQPPVSNMNASQWQLYKQNQLQQYNQQRSLEKPKSGTFANHLVNVHENLLGKPFDEQTEKNCEMRTTEKIVLLNNQKWDIFISEHPYKSPIVDKSSIPLLPDNNHNGLSLRLISPPSNGFLNSIYPSSSTPPSPPPAPSPELIPASTSISNPNSPPSPSSPALSSIISSESPASPSAPFPLGVSTYDLIESSTFTQNGLPIVISYDMSVNADQIHVNFNHASNTDDAVHETEFLSSSSSIVFDDEASHLWVRSGNFVRSFNINVHPDGDFGSDLIQSDQTIMTGPHRSYRSAMTFWDRSLVLSSNSTILTWKPEFMYPSDSPAREEMDEEEEAGKISEYFGVCLTLIVPSIDALTTVDDCLVVASSEYHTAHIIAPNGACDNRAIGHTAGITALHSYNMNSFLTGSADQTAKFWDVRIPSAVYSFHRHNGIVTSVFGDGNGNPDLIFTGGTDGCVRAWDIRNMKNLFSVDIGDATPQSIFYDYHEKVLKVVASERCGDYFYDLGKFSYHDDSAKLVDYGLNSIITFQCPNQ